MLYIYSNTATRTALIIEGGVANEGLDIDVSYPIQQESQVLGSQALQGITGDYVKHAQLNVL